MVGKLLHWALDNVVVVLLAAASLLVVGGYAFFNVNVEAYPDPAPSIVEVVAPNPGASAEEVERLVTVPLEVGLAGMPGLKYTRSKSLFGLAHLRNQFDYGVPYDLARQEVVNRLAMIDLPNGVKPTISPASPIGEIYRYTLSSPKDALGREIYTLNDLKALQDWTLGRELKRVRGVAGVVTSGGTIKRYEIHPDPDRLKEYGITLQQLENAIAGSNANVGGDYVVQGSNVQVVRGIGLIGGGEDPMMRAASMDTPEEAAAYLRAEDKRRLREIRKIVVAATNNVPIRVGQLVEGGPLRSEDELGEQGVVVAHQTRQGKFSITRPLLDRAGREVRNARGERVIINDEDRVQGIVNLRKGEKSLPTLEAVIHKIEELNTRKGVLLPGVQIVPYYDRHALIDVTTETVRENLLVGVLLVSVILLMFLSNIRSALIVALNIPLAVLFAFAILFMRGKSANLLSIGAVDFGIIVDSSVIIVENIYRRLTSGESRELPLRERILRGSREVESSLFFSTLIMVCALLPLFTMQGPEGQIFGPMADTYAFALGGALLLALTISPALCLLLFRRMKPTPDNLMVRWLKSGYLKQLERALDHRTFVVVLFAALLIGTAAMLPWMGREFMPQLEEGNIVVRGTFPVNIALDEAADKARLARNIIIKYPEVRLSTSQVGRPDDGTDPTGYYNAEFFVPLNSPGEWPIPPGRTSARSKEQLIDDINAELDRLVIGVNWDFSQYIRDNVLEALSGVKGENSIKIFGPDLDKLEELANACNQEISRVHGVSDPGVFRIKGQTNLAFPIDRAKCSVWNVSVADVEDVIQTAVGGSPFTKMYEGEKIFDVTLRWPERLRQSQDYILDIPVDVIKNMTTSGSISGVAATTMSGASTGISAIGTSASMPALTGSTSNATLNDLSRVPRRRLKDLVTPVDIHGAPDPNGSFDRPGASTISREQTADQGGRFIAVKFGVRGRDLASTVDEAQKRVAPIVKPPYYATWSGEFQQMQEGERRLLVIIPVSLTLIFILLYLAFQSLIDALLVLCNVLALSLGGVWALLLTGTNFSISAAVGFISIFGVAIMDGLLLVSYFNHLRAQGVELREAIMQGAEKRVRPIMMTALTAIFGLLPAALSTRIGSQTQRPLAIVVVGGMVTTLFLTRYLMPVLYSYYGHREPRVTSGHVH